MKTAISIPDQVFAQAEQIARRNGISRSELFTKAVLHYIEHQAAAEDEKIARINALVDELGEGAFVCSDASRAQLHSLQDEGW